MKKVSSSYKETVSCDHKSKYGQYFTPYPIANFMAQWVVEKKPKNVLDPAVGNGVFFDAINSIFNEYVSIGYEVDEVIYNYYSLAEKNVLLTDFLNNNWNERYDAIIANPPYAKFQKIENRKVLIDEIFQKTNIKLSGLSNYCLYFFSKCLWQLNAGGRLAFIMPYDFLDGPQGLAVKNYLLSNKHSMSIHFLKYDKIFPEVITTAAIFLIEKIASDTVTFFEYFSEEDFKLNNPSNKIEFTYNQLQGIKKWSNYSLNQFGTRNTVPYSTYLMTQRGLATGCNEFFLLDNKTIDEFLIPNECIKYCISSSTYFDTAFLSTEDVVNHTKKNRILILSDTNAHYVQSYIAWGEKQGFNERYLTAHRKVWYILEKQEPPHILITTTTRDTLRSIMNTADSIFLTSYHGLYIKKDWLKFKNIIFCFMQTSHAHKLLQLSHRGIGHGLIKIQPNDMNEALIIDLEVLTIEDISAIECIYKEAESAKKFSAQHLELLDAIFGQYLY